MESMSEKTCVRDRVRAARRLSERTHDLWHGADVHEFGVGAERVVTQVWGQFSVEPELQLLSCSNGTEKHS